MMPRVKQFFQLLRGTDRNCALLNILLSKSSSIDFCYLSRRSFRLKYKVLKFKFNLIENEKKILDP
jgi:hypothetical protein